ncbi:MAG: glutathione synthase [Bacteroidales bacterium]|nr:glutathione synthase [Bacteroidales bacterium]MCF8351468.1 glutathione synthase [Bacteroidales bacterium]MCF8375068.1 glutathione synthase [Bacteroidales bacterium]MCF8399974.1 glutathione synthase [Bacteroidales bacterium]
MNIAFIMYPWEEVEVKTDSTLRLVYEAARRNHTVAIIYPNNLTIRNSITSAFCKIIGKMNPFPANAVSFYNRVRFKEQLLPLSGFDAIFLRSNPPVDNIMLNFLDSVKEDTFFINSVEGIRLANNKLYSAAFYDPDNKMIPITHVSKNKEYLKRVIRESSKNKMILKPLNAYGGHGVIILERNASQNINSLLDFYIGGKEGRGNYVILQEYIEGAEKGDVRILMLNGEPIGAMNRVPAEDDIRSNIHAGGHEIKHALTKVEKEICKNIGPRLVKDGLYFVGLDVINGKLLEVNVLSPGGIVRINRLNRIRLERKVIDFVEEVVQSREMVINRKKEFKRRVSDANIDN